MTDDRNRPIPLVWLIIICVAIVFLINVSWASGDRIKQNVDVSSNQTVQGDSSKAYALGGSDVDINQCYRSFGNAFWVDTKVNRLCLADSLDAKGLHEAAGRLRCSVKSVGKLFENDFICRSMMTMEPQIIEIPEVEEVIDSDEEDDYHEEQAQLYEDLQAKVRNLEQAAQRPIKIQKKVVNQPFLSDEKRAKLQAVLDE